MLNKKSFWVSTLYQVLDSDAKEAQAGVPGLEREKDT